MPLYMKKIAIQGVKGSNHHIVAEKYYGNNIELIECLSFDEMVTSVITNISNNAVMAIENTIAGSIIPNYALIDNHNLHIIGEYYLPIHHYLMALPNQKINTLQQVCSHPMALLQCKNFFKNIENIKLIEDVDTAEVAKRITDKKLKHVGAIAPKIAADIYGLEILASNIESIKNNETRFVILQNTNSVIPKNEINKASLKFELNHKRGSLATVLNILSDCKLNLTKIQSLPRIETPWKYSFFVDVTFTSYDDYKKAISVLEIIATNMKVLGEYKNGRL